MSRTIKYHSNSGRVYEIKMRNGVYGFCSCPAWKFQSKHPGRRVCKHIRAVKRMERAAA